MQGAQLFGRPEEGPGIEGAPQDLLDRVTNYLIQERGKLRAEAATSIAGSSHTGKKVSLSSSARTFIRQPSTKTVSPFCISSGPQLCLCNFCAWAICASRAAGASSLALPCAGIG